MTNIPYEERIKNRSNEWYYYKCIRQYHFIIKSEGANRRYKEEIARLNNLINTILDFNFFKECPLNFGFSDENEEKSQDVFYEDDYCEKNCNDDYKKCWLKYFERLQELKEEGK